MFLFKMSLLKNWIENEYILEFLKSIAWFIVLQGSPNYAHNFVNSIEINQVPANDVNKFW